MWWCVKTAPLKGRLNISWHNALIRVVLIIGIMVILSPSSLSSAPVVAGDSGQGEHAAPGHLLALLDHHHALMPLLQDHARPLVPSRQRHWGIIAGTLRRLDKNIKYHIRFPTMGLKFRHLRKVEIRVNSTGAGGFLKLSGEFPIDIRVGSLCL